VGKVDIEFSDRGERQLKNIDRPVYCWQWDGKVDSATNPEKTTADASLEQKIHFCTSSDGAEIGYPHPAPDRPWFAPPIG